MKKLLSLLSVLTISGTALPTTIAASPYQKEKQINLENLNRSKRGAAGTGFAEGVSSVLDKFKTAQQNPNINNGKYTAPGYVVFPEKQYKDYQNKVNELYQQGKINYHY